MLVPMCLDSQLVKPEQLKKYDLPQHLHLRQLANLIAQTLCSGSVRGDDERPFHWLCTNHNQSTISTFPDGCVHIITDRQSVLMCEQLAVVPDRQTTQYIINYKFTFSRSRSACAITRQTDRQTTEYTKRQIYVRVRISLTMNCVRSSDVN